MNILMITPYLPYPPESGGQTRSYHLLKRLVQHHNITLFCYYRREDEKRNVTSLQKLGIKVIVVKRRSAFHPIHFILGLFTHLPFLLISTYLSLGLRSAVTNELKEGNYDLIHCETFYVLPNVPPTQLPLVLVEQTVEYYVYQHFVSKLRPFFIRFFFGWELAKLLQWEKRSWQKAARILTVSPEDKEAIEVLDPRQKGKIAVVPNGTETATFAHKGAQKKYHLNKPTFCYVGNFKWLQNKEALDYLITTMYPVLRGAFPGCRLIVAGKHIPKEYYTNDASIEFMESFVDIRTVYAKADVLLAPIFGPGGTRLKILEAMASRTLVVTTSVGAMGLDLTDKKEVLMFNDVYELTDKLKEVLSDRKRFVSIIEEAYEKVKQEFDWDSIVKKLEENYQKVLRQK